MNSISTYERRDSQPEYLTELNRRENIKNITGFLIMIVLTLGIVFVAYDLLHSPEKARAAAVVDDKAICMDSLTWFLKGETSIVDYCVNLKGRGL